MSAALSFCLAGWQASVLQTRRRVRRTGPGLFALAPARAPPLRRRFLRVQQAFALSAVGELEALPPIGELDRDLAAMATQPEKIIGGAEARMLEYP